MRRLVLLLAALGCMAAAGDPSERLADPGQEARARALYQQIRCVVCQNESIDDSEAEVAALLRRSVREQIAAGRSDAEVRAYLVDRYGEFVLLKPSWSAANALLWAMPLMLLLAGGGVILWRARRAQVEIDAESLSPEEEARLAALTRDE
jgi:cytochrome c-type biogenesis protein CcmH